MVGCGALKDLAKVAVGPKRIRVGDHGGSHHQVHQIGKPLPPLRLQRPKGDHAREQPDEGQTLRSSAKAKPVGDKGSYPRHALEEGTLKLKVEEVPKGVKVGRPLPGPFMGKEILPSNPSPLPLAADHLLPGPDPKPPGNFGK